MDIRDVKIQKKDWCKFSPYIYIDNLKVNWKVSIILFALDEEETTFNRILEMIKYYHGELENNGEIEYVYLSRGILSSIDPIFFQKYAKEEHGASLDNYQEQANCGAIYYCEDFINKLYEKMNKDGLFDRE